MGEVETPWPAFVFASKIFAKTSHDQQMSAAIKNQLFPALFESAQIFKSSSSHKDSVDRIMKEFHHTKEDAEMWLSRVRYGFVVAVTVSVKADFVFSHRYSNSSEMAVDGKQLQKSIQILKSIGLIPKDFLVENLWEPESNLIAVQ
jgi:hypothetical protein